MDGRYSIAKQLWHFTSVDLCEMARNSVLQSGFDEETKAPCFERSGESFYMIAVSIQQVKLSSCLFGFFGDDLRMLS